MESVIMDTEKLILSPSNRARLRAKNAAMKIKYGSPNLKEVLRQRCQTRFKEKRRDIFNERRCMGSDTDLIQSIICRELDEICDIADQDENGKLLDSNNGMIPEDALIASEVEKLLNSDEDDLEKLLENRVVCPICMKGGLNENIVNGMTCCDECNEQLPAPKGIQDLEYRIRGAMGNHAENCCSMPSVTKVYDGTQNLIVMCFGCSYYHAIF